MFVCFFLPRAAGCEREFHLVCVCGVYARMELLGGRSSLGLKTMYERCVVSHSVDACLFQRYG